MSTRSNIVYDTGESVRAVYCHHDGYLDHNGRILFEHYNSEDEVEALIELGDFTSLKPTLEETRKKLMNCEPEIYRTLDQYMHLVHGSDIEYIYLWDKYMWWISRNIEINLWDRSKYEKGYREWIFYHSQFEPLAQELAQWDFDNHKAYDRQKGRYV
jgi:hypothetical protein